MKKLLYLGAAALLTSLGMASCGDNTDFSKAHILTDDELAEQARQDSIKQAQMAMINADYLYDYTVEFYISENSYDGAFLPIDTKKMAEDFGISEIELVHGIANLRSDYLENGAYADGAKLQGFAIEGSTHQDNMTAYNTNGIWGHWWDENGDVTAWGDNARVFLEYYEPENEGDPYGFTVGQMPGKLQPNQEVTVLECLKYQDTRMALRIKVIGRERGEIVAGIVGEEDIQAILSPYGEPYVPEAFTFNLDAVLSALDLSEITTNNLLAYNEDGSFAQELNADNGFWFDKSGPVGGWGDQASCWISYGMIENEPSVIGIALMPGATASGDHYDHDFGFYNGDKIYMLHVHVDVYADDFVPEIKTTQNVNVTIPINTPDYQAVPVAIDLAQVLVDLGVSELTVGNLFAYDADGGYVLMTNADAGFWYDKTGPVGGWGEDASCWISYGITEDPATIGVALMPGATEVGDVYEHDFGFHEGNNASMIHVTMTVGEEQAEAPIEGEIVYTAAYSCDMEGLEAQIEFDINAVLEALGVESSTELTVVSKKADGSLTMRYTGNDGYGFWYNTDGQVAPYGEAAVCVSYYGWDADNNVEYPEDVYLLYLNVDSANAELGQSYTVPFGLMANGKVAMLDITIKPISFGAEE